ncbi:acyl carrier protein [Streptomyces formicae]|uniref:Carrier domain-containing protein n=1 Tax=Streptomyces formicae TaxID=1616117 RepID=A0A291QL78_9ACTN|nr:acyl carrier protein [Streptomyces formicae]ATL32213.1 hypothetical protein KY5_7195 [Streptomyces formicae]
MTQAQKPTAQPELSERFVTLLTSILDREPEPGELSPHTTFESLDMDSLYLMELVVAAEQEFGIVLPDDAMDLSPSSTLADATRVFQRAT